MTKGQKMLDPETIHRNVNGGWLRPAVLELWMVLFLILH